MSNGDAKFPSGKQFLDALRPALRQAISIASALEGRVVNRPKSGEASEVKAALTIADTASQEALLVALREHFPRIALEAEEDTPSVARFARTGDALVVIDPIDGTLEHYLRGRGPYSILLGLAQGDAYRAAFVALPREKLCFEAQLGGGARGGEVDAPAQPLRSAASGRRVFVTHDLPEPALRVLEREGYEPQPASGGAIAVAPLVPGVCGGLRWMRGQSISVRGRIGALVAREAGALVEGADSRPFTTSLRAPSPALLVAADAATLETLRHALATLA